MKKIYILASLMCVAGAANAYTTENTGVTYTLASLAEIENSKVTLKEGQTYQLTENLEIAETDKLQLLAGDVLEIANDVSINIYGEAIFNPAEKAYITRTAEDAEPQGIVFWGKTTLSNLDYSGGGIRYNGTEPLTVDKCDFHDINSKLSKYGAIQLGFGKSKDNKITNCTFTDLVPGAINTSANLGVGLLIENNTFTNVSTQNELCPYINVSSNAEEPVIVRGNKLYGAKLEKPGGIGVSNMLNTPGKNDVIISGNYVENCSWGINLIGGMNVQLFDNHVKDNRWDPDNNGGIGVTMYSIPAYPLEVYAYNNIIEGNKWGPCNVVGTKSNFGKTETDENGLANEGNNVFRNNYFVNDAGETVTCDFCNNSQVTVYAQNNTWSDAETEEEAAKYVGDTKWNSSYGTIVYGPIKAASGVKTIMPDFTNTFEGEVELYRLDGVKVFSGDASKISEAGEGMYIIRQGDKSRKIIVK